MHLLSLGTSAWRRLISRPGPVERPTVKVRELTWQSVEASVWPVGCASTTSSLLPGLGRQKPVSTASGRSFVPSSPTT